MNGEKFYDAFENINDELLLSAFEEPSKISRRPFKKIKWSVLAACVALLVAVPVMAAVFKVDLLVYEGGWSASSDVFIPIEEFSDEVIETAKNQKETVCCYRMKSLSEAEEFLGIEFPKNELIERRSGNGPNVYMEAYNRNGEWESGKVNCYVMLANDEEGNLESTITSAFFYGNIDVRYIVDAGEDEKWGTGTGWGTEGVSSEKEIYRNSAGIDFRIVQNVREYGCDFAAYAAINGVLTEVKYFTAYAENGEYGYEPLKLILEGYVQ